MFIHRFISKVFFVCATKRIFWNKAFVKSKERVNIKKITTANLLYCLNGLSVKL